MRFNRHLEFRDLFRDSFGDNFTTRELKLRLVFTHNVISDSVGGTALK